MATVVSVLDHYSVYSPHDTPVNTDHENQFIGNLMSINSVGTTVVVPCKITLKFF